MSPQHLVCYMDFEPVCVLVQRCLVTPQFNRDSCVPLNHVHESVLVWASGHCCQR